MMYLCALEENDRLLVEKNSLGAPQDLQLCTLNVDLDKRDWNALLDEMVEPMEGHRNALWASRNRIRLRPQSTPTGKFRHILEGGRAFLI